MSVLEDVTTGLKRAVDALVQADPLSLGDGETVVALHRELERIKAVTARVTAAFDVSRAWEADGARSAAAWLIGRCHLHAATAKTRVRTGRALRHMPLVEAAWLGGAINDTHAAMLAKAQCRAPEAFERDQEQLVGYAIHQRFSYFGRLVGYWMHCADPDGTEADADKAHDARRLHLSQSLDNMWFLDGAFDPINGEILAKVLRDIEDELFDADWAEAKARVGDDVTVSDLRRTPPQRRADAIIEMARRAAAMPAGARLPAPLFTVVVDLETLAGRICELASGAVVSPGSLVPWLDEAYIERIVFGPANRVLNVGERRRLFSGATRRAIQVRDGQCYHPLCEEPAENCEIDHIERYSDGGLTVEGTGRPGCSYHNKLREKELQEKRRA
jgi:hypothetical protein